MSDEIMRVSAKGQLTIPVSIRKKLSIREGDYLQVHLDGGSSCLRKIEPVRPLSEHDPTWQMIGSAASGRSDGSLGHDRIIAAEEIKRWQE